MNVIVTLPFVRLPPNNRLRNALQDYAQKCGNRPPPPGGCWDLATQWVPKPIFNGAWNGKPNNNPVLNRRYGHNVPSPTNWKPDLGLIGTIAAALGRDILLPFYLIRVPQIYGPLPGVA
jgi:hypothetical protein